MSEANREHKYPTSEYGMRYCREHGWVEAVLGEYTKYIRKPCCPECGPSWPGVFRNPSEMVNHDHRIALLEKEFHPLQEGDSQDA